MYSAYHELRSRHAVHIQKLRGGATQVTEFQVVASEFLQRLKASGPGLPNTDLAKGSELLKKFQVHSQKLGRPTDMQDDSAWLNSSSFAPSGCLDCLMLGLCNRRIENHEGMLSI